MWRLRGHLLRRLRRVPEAIRAYRRADRWFADAGDPREQGRCAIGLVDSLMYVGRYGEALKAARTGRRLLARARDPDALARLANNEANVLHRLDRPEQALERYRRARSWLTRARDPRGAMLIDGNIANCLSLLGELNHARALYLTARATLDELGYAIDALNAEHNLAYLEFLDFRYERALEDLARVRGMANERGSPSLAALATLDRTEILLRMGQLRDARDEAMRAEEQLMPLGLAYERAKAWTFAALAEHRLGLGGSARIRLERALEVFHGEGNDVWAGEVLIGLATVWWREGNPRPALPLLSAAGRCFVRAGDLEREAYATALLARVRLQTGDHPGARAALRRLARLGRRRSPRFRHVVLGVRAALARAEGRTREARRHLRQAASESERLAARILDEQWRSSFWGEWGWPHLELAVLELAAGRVSDAFEALEAGRGRTLVGACGRTTQVGVTEVPESARRWAAARMARDRHRTTGSAPRTAVARPPVSWPAQGPLRRLLTRQTSAPVRTHEVQRALDPDALIIDYLLHEGTLSAILVDRRDIRGRTGLVRERHLTELVQALLFDLRGALLVVREERRTDRVVAALDELSAAILWPALEAAGRIPKTLAVVPVGPLARLPWAALRLPDGRALCEAMEVQVVPGMRLGFGGRRRAGRAIGAPLVVASAEEDLDQVGPEARGLIEAFPEARLIEGGAATADRFLSLAPGAAWIHFAGHGLFRADRPHESALRFSDRWLSASELAGLELAASWVTLSACQTARSLLQPGEEWFGLARTFLLGGADRVLASQWDVEDQSTAMLMSDVYRHLATGSALPLALSQVQASRQRAGEHPVDWAGFVVLGGPRAAMRISGQPAPTS